MAGLQGSVFQVQDEKRQAETSIRDLEQRLDQRKHEMDLLQAENSRLTNEIGELRQTNKGLDTTKFSQERSLTELQLKNQSQQRELEDKSTTIADLKSHLKSLQDAKDSLGDDMKTMKQQHDKQQKKIDYCKDQMEKGNEHIQALEYKKNQYKKQIIQLKSSSQQNQDNKETILRKLEKEI